MAAVGYKTTAGQEGSQSQAESHAVVRDRDLLGTPWIESGYLFSGLWRGKGRMKKSRERERNREGGRSEEKGERQRLPL